MTSLIFIYMLNNKKRIISLILFENVETSVPQYFEILPEFSTNQNFYGRACTPSSYTTTPVTFGHLVNCICVNSLSSNLELIALNMLFSVHTRAADRR